MRKYLFLFFFPFLLYCSEPPTFERNNANDPKSESFIPDTVENIDEYFRTTAFSVINSTETDEKFEKIISIKWPEYFKDYDYRIYKIDMYGRKTLFGELDHSISVAQDTISNPGSYTYIIKRLLDGYEFIHSFGEISFSHFVVGPKMQAGKHWYGVDVVQLDENRILVTNPTINSQLKSEFYDYRTKTWKLVKNPPNNDIPRTHLVSENKAIRLDRRGYSYLDLETLTWTNSTNWSIDHYFHSVLLDAENILLTEHYGKRAYLFNPENQKLVSTASMIRTKNQYHQLVKMSESTAIVIGAGGFDNKSHRIEKYDLKSKTWVKLNDLKTGFHYPKAYALNKNEILIFEGKAGKGTKVVLKYNIENMEQKEIGTLYGSYPRLSRIPNKPVYSFPKNGGEIIILNKPTKNDVALTYQIYNDELEKLSNPVHHYRNNFQASSDFGSLMIGVVGWGVLPNGDILLTSEYRNTAIFKLRH